MEIFRMEFVKFDLSEFNLANSANLKKETVKY